MRSPRLRLTLITAVTLIAFVTVCWGVPWVIRARQAGARESCRSHLRNFAMEVLAYPSVHGSFPPGTIAGGSLPPEQRISWVWPVVEGSEWTPKMSFLFEPDRPWDAPENRLPKIACFTPGEPDEIVNSPAPPVLPSVETCPANHCKVGPGMPGPLHYVGIAGVGSDASTLPKGHLRAGIFGYDRQTRTVDITDGLSTTMMLAETTLANGPWTAGGPATVRGLDQGRLPYLGPGRQFGGAHPGGAMVAFADGSVRFLPETIAPKVFVGSSRVDLQACKLEYSIVSPK